MYRLIWCRVCRTSSKTRVLHFGSCVWLLQNYFDMADINCAVCALNTQIITLHLTQMCWCVFLCRANTINLIVTSFKACRELFMDMVFKESADHDVLFWTRSDPPIAFKCWQFKDFSLKEGPCHPREVCNACESIPYGDKNSPGPILEIQLIQESSWCRVAKKYRPRYQVDTEI
jgi:hypothetical protein